MFEQFMTFPFWTLTVQLLGLVALLITSSLLIAVLWGALVYLAKRAIIAAALRLGGRKPATKEKNL